MITEVMEKMSLNWETVGSKAFSSFSSAIKLVTRTHHRTTQTVGGSPDGDRAGVRRDVARAQEKRRLCLEPRAGFVSMELRDIIIYFFGVKVCMNHTNRERKKIRRCSESTNDTSAVTPHVFTPTWCNGVKGIGEP